MSVNIDSSGRRWVGVEVEVPGTPEEVWEALATPQGLSSWFVPSEVDGRKGGSIVCHMGPGMDALANITGWEPPHRLTAEGDWGPDVPPVATEWTVEARSGDTCVVRVVHSLFASTDDWDGQLEGTETGWPGFFEILRLYLTHFRGQPCASICLMGSAAGSETEAWDGLTEALGLSGSGDAEADTPPFAGTIESSSPGRAAVRLDAPQPGIASLSAFSMGEQVMIGMSLFLFGNGAGEKAARDEPLWQAWMAERYPMGG